MVATFFNPDGWFWMLKAAQLLRWLSTVSAAKPNWSRLVMLKDAMVDRVGMCRDGLRVFLQLPLSINDPLCKYIQNARMEGVYVI
mmetsp:Transcript_7706/g.11297  ORF Transcript_7706/g.11297 Transcript_7706/m.11297 type:complete len:85 (+) Transcript_7706:650-904(+)